MINGLPYIPLDEELSLNFSLTMLTISELSHSSKGNLVLDINKVQIFLYLIKNPSKISLLLAEAGKKSDVVDTQQTYTIKSLSSNVDILFDPNRAKFLIKYLAMKGLLLAEKTKDNSTKLFLSDKGKVFSKSLDGEYFDSVRKIIKVVAPLHTLSTPKLNSLLNKVFRG
ncbi:hypothetical protein WN993_001022 [Yersinia enterocolitica]